MPDRLNKLRISNETMRPSLELRVSRTKESVSLPRARASHLALPNGRWCKPGPSAQSQDSAVNFWWKMT